MNKTLKVIIAVVMMLATLIALTACGGNKIVATRESSDSGYNVKEKLEVSFKGDEVNKVVDTMTFDSKDEATAFAAIFKLANEDGMKVKQSGKKVTVTLTKDAAKDSYKGSKDDVKKALEAEGYKVK